MPRQDEGEKELQTEVPVDEFSHLPPLDPQERLDHRMLHELLVGFALAVVQWQEGTNY